MKEEEQNDDHQSAEAQATVEGSDQTEPTEHVAQPAEKEPETEQAEQEGVWEKVQAVPAAIAASARNAESAGLLVFVLSGAAITLSLMITVITLDSDSHAFEHYVNRESIRILMTLAGTGIIVSFLSRTSSPVLSAFGFLLIGALIVPTDEIIRIYSVVSGSDITFDDVSSNPGQKDSSGDRSHSVAMNSFLDLEKNYEMLRDYDISERAQFIKIIEDRIRFERALELRQEVQQRDAYQILQALRDGSFDELKYKYDQQTLFNNNLDYLRQAGLIAMQYGDLNSVTLTQRGARVVLAQEPTYDLVSNQAANPTVGPCSVIQPLPFGSDSPLFEFTTSIDSDSYTCFSFQLDRPSRVEFSVTAKDDYADPYFSIYSMLSLDSEIGHDDDGGGGLNPSLTQFLASGDYFIAVRTYLVETDAIVRMAIPQEVAQQ